LRLDLVDVENRAEWRWRICVTDPSAEEKARSDLTH